MVDLKANKDRFISLLTSTNRPGVQNLIDFLNRTDFFEAPRSTRFHNNFKGGLCAHSLNVYDNLKKLNNLYKFNFSDDSLRLVGLLHDLSKVNFYEYSTRNVKKYNKNGAYSDNMGKFDWETTGFYKVKDAQLQDFVFYNHEINSYVLINKWVTLTEPEMIAVMNHHAVFDTGGARLDIGEIYNRYPLAAFLHIADTMAAYIDENPYIIDEEDHSR